MFFRAGSGRFSWTTRSPRGMRVIAFFHGFQREAGAADHVTRSTSGASGRARHADGPIYTRDQIAKLYRQHQQGAYRGREAEWARQEADFYRAQREGRVLGGM